MRVRYIGNDSSIDFENGMEYEVISIERGWYRIVDPFTKEDYLYPPTLFEKV